MLPDVVTTNDAASLVVNYWKRTEFLHGTRDKTHGALRILREDVVFSQTEKQYWENVLVKMLCKRSYKIQSDQCVAVAQFPPFSFAANGGRKTACDDSCARQMCGNIFRRRDHTVTRCCVRRPLHTADCVRCRL